MIRKYSGLCLIFVMTVAILAPLPRIATAQAAPTAQATLTPLALSPCKFSAGLGSATFQVDANCGVLSVPEDRSKPDGRKIDLHVTVLPAANPDDKGLPVFHLEGGPGGAAIHDFGETWYGAYRLLREHHDIVLLDQRGTGTSASLQCTEITNATFSDLAKPLTDQADADSSLKRLSDCFTRLSATNDPAFYTSTIMADDTDDVRAALGYDQIDVYGNSYGTWLGQIYLKRHGEHVHALVLDSVVGPWNFADLNVTNTTQDSLNKVFDLCTSDPDCNKIFPDLVGKLQKALDSLDKQPVTTSAMGLKGSYSIVMTRSRFLYAIQLLLYETPNLGLMPQIIADAANGNYATVSSLLAAALEQIDDISVGLQYSVICSEEVPFFTDALIKQDIRDNFYNSAANTVDQLRAACKVWRSAELNAEDVAPVKSDRPVLILSGEFDPVTPVSYGQEAHQRLSNSTLAVFPYQAHGPMATSKCAQTMVVNFFNAPDQPVDTSCTANDIRPIFNNVYKVELTPFTAPNGTFTANVPKGWTVDTKTSGNTMTFLTSPDGLQVLGIGVFKGMKPSDAQKAAITAIEAQYGPLDVQYSQSVLFITIMAHTVEMPNEMDMGMLISGGLANTTVVWQAAPANIFSAVALPVATGVFPSVVAR